MIVKMQMRKGKTVTLNYSIVVFFSICTEWFQSKSNASNFRHRLFNYISHENNLLIRTNYFQFLPFMMWYHGDFPIQRLLHYQNDLIKQILKAENRCLLLTNCLCVIYTDIILQYETLIHIARLWCITSLCTFSAFIYGILVKLAGLLLGSDRTFLLMQENWMSHQVQCLHSNVSVAQITIPLNMKIVVALRSWILVSPFYSDWITKTCYPVHDRTKGHQHTCFFSFSVRLNRIK